MLLLLISGLVQWSSWRQQAASPGYPHARRRRDVGKAAGQEVLTRRLPPRFLGTSADYREGGFFIPNPPGAPELHVISKSCSCVAVSIHASRDPRRVGYDVELGGRLRREAGLQRIAATLGFDPPRAGLPDYVVELLVPVYPRAVADRTILDFGAVTPGEPKTMTFSVDEYLDDASRFRDLRLTSDSESVACTKMGVQREAVSDGVFRRRTLFRASLAPRASESAGPPPGPWVHELRVDADDRDYETLILPVTWRTERLVTAHPSSLIIRKGLVASATPVITCELRSDVVFGLGPVETPAGVTLAKPARPGSEVGKRLPLAFRLDAAKVEASLARSGPLSITVHLMGCNQKTVVIPILGLSVRTPRKGGISTEIESASARRPEVRSMCP